LTQVSAGNLLLVGKVIGPHGLGGLLRIWSYSGSEASFLNAGTVFLGFVSGEINEFSVTSVRPHKNAFLMKLEGLNSSDEVEKYRGIDILINKEAITREEDEYFWHELLGLKVYLDTGQYLGVVSQIISTGANDIYVVKGADKEICIPAIYEVVKEIDVENEKMIISAMEGLLDLNEV
jgi:16S rRNA processing protein RimM